MARLFWGEYEPKDQKLSAGTARVAFLNAVRLHVPQVLEELKRQVFERYELMGSPLILNWWQLRYGGSDLQGLYLALHRWSRRWSLETEWCLDQAVRTLWNWRCFHSELQELRWQQGGGGWMVPTNEDERRFVFEHPGWEPTYDFRAKIKKEIEEAFKKQLDDYLDRIENLVKERGYIKTKRVNEPEHFEWLACFQVAGMSYDEIRNKFRPQDKPQHGTYLSDDTKAIRKAVNDLARFIELPLRKDGTAPGRRSSKGKVIENV